ALRSRGPHIILVHHLEYCGAGHPHDNSHHVRAERDRRHDDVPYSVPRSLEVPRQEALSDIESALRSAGDAVAAAAGGRQPVQITGDHEDEHDPEPEARHRDAEETEE